MKTWNRRASLGLFPAAWLIFMQAVSAQQGYPNRPIKLIVPAAAGGTADILARQLGERMGQSLRQTVIVENRPGAGQSLGTAEVARARPDGYTLLLGTSSSHAINPSVYKNLPYDVLKDFSFISTIALSDYALSVPSSLPFKTVSDLLKANSKAKPLTFASVGVQESKRVETDFVTGQGRERGSRPPVTENIP